MLGGGGRNADARAGVPALRLARQSQKRGSDATPIARSVSSSRHVCVGRRNNQREAHECPLRFQPRTAGWIPPCRSVANGRVAFPKPPTPRQQLRSGAGHRHAEQQSFSASRPKRRVSSMSSSGEARTAAARRARWTAGRSGGRNAAAAAAQSNSATPPRRRPGMPSFASAAPAAPTPEPPIDSTMRDPLGTKRHRHGEPASKTIEVRASLHQPQFAPHYRNPDPYRDPLEVRRARSGS